MSRLPNVATWFSEWQSRTEPTLQRSVSTACGSLGSFSAIPPRAVDRGRGEVPAMPNRILWEDICTSEQINEMADSEEAFFYRLLTKCDDFGRFDARAEIIRAGCYPLRLKKVNAARIDIMLLRLEVIGVIRLYEVDGKPFLQVTGWDRRQRVRNKRSKFPEPPPAEVLTTVHRKLGEVAADIGGHLTSIDSESPRVAANGGPHAQAPVSSDSDSDWIGVEASQPSQDQTLARNNGGRGVAEGKAVRGSPEAAPGGNQPSATEPAGFAEFYAAFPLHNGRGQAAKAYRAALKSADRKTLLDGAVRFAADPNLPADRSKIPYPATWLNGKRWLDDPLPAQLASVGGRFHRDDPLPPEVS